MKTLSKTIKELREHEFEFVNGGQTSYTEEDYIYVDEKNAYLKDGEWYYISDPKHKKRRPRG